MKFNGVPNHNLQNRPAFFCRPSEGTLAQVYCQLMVRCVLLLPVCVSEVLLIEFLIRPLHLVLHPTLNVASPTCPQSSQSTGPEACQGAPHMFLGIPPAGVLGQMHLPVFGHVSL
eukprot:1161540-Pelagomonas_calceolata.AAC.10